MAYSRRRRFGRRYGRRPRYTRSSRMSLRSRRYRGRRGYGRRRTRAALNSQRKFVTRMKYVTTVDLEPPSAGLSKIHWFRGNSIYDPDITGTGHQPLGHDEAAVLYERYRVRGCKVNAKVCMTSATETNQEGHLMLWAGTDVQSYGGLTVAQALEKTGFVSKHIAADSTPAGSTLSMYRSTKQIYPEVSPKDEVLSADMGANPELGWVIGVMWVPNLPTVVVGVDVIVTLTYYVELTSPVTLVQS